MKQEDLQKLIGKVIEFCISENCFTKVKLKGLVHECYSEVLVIITETNKSNWCWVDKIHEESMIILPKEEAIIWRLENL